MLISEKYAFICSFCSNLYEQNWKDLTIFTNYSTNVCLLRKDAPKKADFVPKKVTNCCIKNSVYLLDFFNIYAAGESSAKFSKEAVKP